MGPVRPPPALPVPNPLSADLTTLSRQRKLRHTPLSCACCLQLATPPWSAGPGWGGRGENCHFGEDHRLPELASEAGKESTA